MSTKQTTPMWKCENCGQRMGALNVNGYCAFCGSDAVTMDLGDAEIELAEAMSAQVITLNSDQAFIMYRAVTKVLNEWEDGGIRTITQMELAALRELQGALMGVTIRN
jgi:hypothetical protein